jgi:hypothetical protein
MYKLSPLAFNQTVPTCVIRLSDGAAIPFSIANTDYQAFLKYQAEGGKVYGADETIPAEEQGA